MLNIFVFTFRDIFGLVALCIFAIVLIIMYGYAYICDAIDKWKRRKKQK